MSQQQEIVGIFILARTVYLKQCTTYRQTFSITRKGHHSNFRTPLPLQNSKGTPSAYGVKCLGMRKICEIPPKWQFYLRKRYEAHRYCGSLVGSRG